MTTTTEKNAHTINNYFASQNLQDKIRVNIAEIKSKVLPIEIFGTRKEKWERIYKIRAKAELKKLGFSSVADLTRKAKAHQKANPPEQKQAENIDVIDETVTTTEIDEISVTEDYKINLPQDARTQLKIWTRWNDVVRDKGTDLSKYSADEVKLAREYSGIGGLVAKYGDILKQELGISKMAGILDQFFTPYEVIEKMWELAHKHGFSFKNKHILEPSCGNGRILEYIPEGNTVLAFEPDENPYIAAKISFPNFEIKNDILESLFYRNNNPKMYTGLPRQKFDLVIGNPPYRKFTSRFKDEKKHTLAETYDQYFIARSIDLLKIDGLSIMIVPNSFMQNDNKYNEFKDKFNQKAELLEAYRLPNSIFPNTDIGTDILVFRKK